MEPKEELIDDFPLMPAEKETANKSAACQKEPKEEPLDLLTDEIPPQNSMGEKICKEEEMDEDDMESSHFDVSAFGPLIDHFPIPLEMKEEIIEAEDENKEDEEKGQNTKYVDLNPKDSYETVEVEKKRRPSRHISRPLKYADYVDHSGGNVEPSRKKSRSESKKTDGNFLSQSVSHDKRSSHKDSTKLDSMVEERREDSIMYDVNDGEMENSEKTDHVADTQKKKRSSYVEHQSESTSKKYRVPKMNETELECPECEFRTTSAVSWVSHLYKQHSTTPTLAGLALLCECGHESFSDRHSRMCTIAHFTLIHKQIEKTTPQCVLCEVQPSTHGGYVAHLQIHHKSTLISNGIYLLCSCGDKIHSHYSSESHGKKCDSRQFSMQKLDKKNTPQCVLCEFYPSTPGGYTVHLQRDHKSTLMANGIYLLCSCGAMIHSRRSSAIHSKKCDSRKFTLHKSINT